MEGHRAARGAAGVRFEVEAAGQPRTVDVTPDGGGWRVMLDGRALMASMVRTGDRWSLLLCELPSGADAPPDGPGSAASRSYDVGFEPRQGGGWHVHVGAAVVPAGLRTSAQRLRRHGGGDPGDGRVLAPMPGRVVKVLVAPGARVEARQGVVVVEAMKMENELRAPRAGVVREVRAVEGASVEAQAVLVVIE
jgi:biotin carboxyl carrier protein